ncbi:PilZ domain-containing protein [Desulfosediminicola flagellatus]|uniref:PilZ domain-containing protein n=1 Tax=Desulfosediminicola flagellatus TaxID=2569541 RepID=UPI0010ACBD56|nr:PilZ domain-containing protein [Desulfosediminicola flagellatus]
MIVTKIAESSNASPVERERRKFKRYPIHQNSMLCNEESLAEVLDISKAGLACRNFVGLEGASGILSDVELLNCEIGLSVQGLKCRLVRSQERKGNTLVQNNQGPDCFLEFVELSDMQANALGTFIENTSRGPGPELIFSNN